MNGWGFFASVIGSLIWPLTLLALVYFIREPLKGLIARLATLKFKGLELDFSAKLDRLEQEISEESGLANLPARATQVSELGDDFQRLADISPPAAVLRAWVAVEETLNMLAQHHGVDLRRGSSPLYLTRVLRQREIIDTRTAEILDSLRALRNLAAHSPASEISRDDAERFRELADEALRILPQSAD